MSPQMRWRKNHPEKWREIQAAYYRRKMEADPDWHANRLRVWRKKNPEKVSASLRRWRVAHPETIARLKRAWDRANPEVGRLKNARRRAAQRKSPINSFSVAEWRELKTQYNHLCAYCGERKPLTMDHVKPLSRGGAHVASNIVPACRPCNSKKGAREASVLGRR